MHVKYLEYIIYVVPMVVIFVTDIYLSITGEVEVAVGCMFRYICCNVIILESHNTNTAILTSVYLMYESESMCILHPYIHWGHT